MVVQKGDTLFIEGRNVTVVHADQFNDQVLIVWSHKDFDHNQLSQLSLQEARKAKAMNDEIITRSVQLHVFDFDCNSYLLIEKLKELSGLNVSVGHMGFFLYAYFNSLDSARAAALDIECMVCCKTEIRKGTFNVTSLFDKEAKLNNWWNNNVRSVIP